MNDLRQLFLYIICIMTLLASMIGAKMAHDTYLQFSTDNQTMARLRDENAILRRDLTDTEKALDEQALKALHLEEENDRLRAEREMSKGRGKM